VCKVAAHPLRADGVVTIVRAMRLPARKLVVLLVACGGGALVAAARGTTNAAPGVALFNDSHFHLTNYVQKGPEAQQFLRMVGPQVGRVAMFGIPLQQEWSHDVSGDFAPTYYLQSDAPLYYYSFTDAHIALAFRSLSKADQARIDPMITGFNPADMYAADHIRRVLEDFPDVFSGIGEFSIHKEFVSGKIAGGAPSLLNPALDRILDFAGQVGLVVLIHNDIDVPFAKATDRPTYLADLEAVFKRHPRTTIIWAHLGLGRVVRPVEQQGEIVSRLLDDPQLAHLNFDISWNEVAKYLYRDADTPRTIARVAAVINRHPDRFLFGTDEVAPTTAKQYYSLYEQYAPLWAALTPEAREKTLKGNYARLFDAARGRVRAWEHSHRPSAAAP
jgi:predicted TIM-barrel fold metal-dependent hydrolase